jgi:hypothetical protein
MLSAKVSFVPPLRAFDFVRFLGIPAKLSAGFPTQTRMSANANTGRESPHNTSFRAGLSAGS